MGQHWVPKLVPSYLSKIRPRSLDPRPTPSNNFEGNTVVTSFLVSQFITCKTLDGLLGPLPQRRWCHLRRMSLQRSTVSSVRICWNSRYQCHWCYFCSIPQTPMFIVQLMFVSESLETHNNRGLTPVQSSNWIGEHCCKSLDARRVPETTRKLGKANCWMYAACPQSLRKFSNCWLLVSSPTQWLARNKREAPMTSPFWTKSIEIAMFHGSNPPSKPFLAAVRPGVPRLDPHYCPRCQRHIRGNAACFAGENWRMCGYWWGENFGISHLTWKKWWEYLGMLLKYRDIMGSNAI